MTPILFLSVTWNALNMFAIWQLAKASRLNSESITVIAKAMRHE